MATRSIASAFLKSGAQIAGYLVVAGIAGVGLYDEAVNLAVESFGATGSVANRASWKLLALFLLVGLAISGMCFALAQLYVSISNAVRHDIVSLARTFHDIREGSLRVNYPTELREFSQIFHYLRESGQKSSDEKTRLKDAGFVDDLSQLSNRRHAEHRLQALLGELKAKGPSSVLILHIDHFKELNDRLGRDSGDALIVGFAKVLRARVRQSDFVARLGTDTFCVIYPYATVEKAAAYAERLRNQLPQEIALLNGTAHTAHWSGGVGAMTESDASVSDVLARADQAVRHAKETARNTTKTHHPDLGLERSKAMLTS
jgi:diguanylate cyclase (GGDEF)-like protein